MKTVKIILFLFYFLGCVCAYKYTKSTVKTHINLDQTIWTVGDRNYAITVSIFSWVGVGAMGIINFLESINTEAPAKW